MPFAFIVVGIVMLVSGVKGTNDQLVTLIKGDLTGQNSFVHWMVAILIIGVIGYIKPLQPISHMFLVLVIVVLIVANRGVFSAFNSQIFAPPNPTTK